MRSSRDDRLALGRSARNDIDETTDTRSEIKDPKDHPVFQGPTGKPKAKGNLGVSGVDFPPRCSDLGPDLNRREDHGIENPASKYCSEQEHQGPIASERNQALAARSNGTI